MLGPLAPVDAALRVSSTPSSATRRAASVVGTAPVAEKPLAGWITPSKLSRLSEVLRLPVTRVETILQGSPAAVRQLEPEQVAQRLRELCSALGVLPKQAAFMVAKQPAYMLLTPLAEIRAKVAELSAVLGVSQSAVLRAALTVPSILRRSTALIDRRVRAYSAMLRCSQLDVLHLMARGPEYLSDTPSSVRQRMTALGYVLRRPRCTIAAMLQARPDLVFMSGKVMNTKVNGLMCILNKQKHHVVTLLVKLPPLLRCNLDSVRNAFGGLQALLRKREGFVYAMACHAPSLLLLTPRGVHQRCTALRRCLAASPEWCEQFTQLRPPGVAQLVLNRRGSLSVMMYLTLRQRAGAAPLAALLAPGPCGGPAAVLGEAWPDFVEWMERRRQYVALRMQQKRAAVRGTPGGAVQAAHGVRQGTSNEAVPVLHPQLPQHQQEALQQQGQQHCALASADSVLPRLPPGDVTPAADVGVRLAAGSLMRHAEAGAGADMLSRPAGSMLASREDCSSSGTGDGVSCRNSSSSSSGLERESEDADGGGAADRGQQPGASASGRPPSWLQLQAEYRRSLQSRARRKAAMASQQGGRDGGEAPTATADVPPPKRARLRCRTQPQHADAPAVLVTSAAAATTGRLARDTNAASAAASGEPDQDGSAPSVSANPRLEPVGLLEVAVTAIAAGGSELEHVLVGRTYISGDGSVPPGEASTPGSEAQLDSNPRRSNNDYNLCLAGARGQRHRHVLRGVLLPGRRQRLATDLAQIGLHDDQTALGASEAAGVVAALDTEVGTLAAQRTTPRDSLPLQRADTCVERADPAVPAAAAAAGPDGLTSALEGSGSAWLARPVAFSNGEDIAHHHAVDPDARTIPLWLHLDSHAIGSTAGGEARSSGGDGGYVPEHARQGEGGAHSNRRTTAAPADEAPEHGATDGVVVVGGNGSVHDIKGLGRESHALGLRGQEPGGGLSIGQAQKLESALGAAVPR